MKEDNELDLNISNKQYLIFVSIGDGEVSNMLLKINFTINGDTKQSIWDFDDLGDTAKVKHSDEFKGCLKNYNSQFFLSLNIDFQDAMFINKKCKNTSEKKLFLS